MAFNLDEFEVLLTAPADAYSHHRLLELSKAAIEEIKRLRKLCTQKALADATTNPWKDTDSWNRKGGVE